LYVKKNKKILKPHIKGTYLCLPKYKYGHGICLPGIHIINFREFVARTFSLYMQELYPEQVENKILEKIVTALEVSYKK
jgi:hypothetical protein